jgi:hypothetical protein
MKYMMNGAYRTQGLMRLTLAGTLVFLTFLWVSNFLMYAQRMGFDPDSVRRYYRGSEEEFRAARTYGSMLEASHGHFAMMALVLLLLTHLSIFIPWSLRVRVVLVVGTFAAALCEELAGWLVRFAHPEFAWLKIGAFLGLQAGLGVLLVGLGWQIARRPLNGGAAASELGPDPGAAAHPGGGA